MAFRAADIREQLSIENEAGRRGSMARGPMVKLKTRRLNHLVTASGLDWLDLIEAHVLDSSGRSFAMLKRRDRPHSLIRP